MNIKGWAGIGALLLILGACSTVDTVKTAIAVKGAELSAQALVDAEWWVCRAASVGSVKDRYGASLERADLYRNFCDGNGQANVIAPE